MKKKLFFKFFVFAVIGAFVTVTSCKDYDDDISGLQKQISENASANGSAISALQTQLTTLQTAATTAQTAADAAKTAAAEAKTAADAAKAAGDEAKADAATAKAKAEEAIAAAAQAKADAIEEAKEEVNNLKTLMESELAGKLDESVFDAALLVLNAQIEGIEDGLSTLGEQVDGIDGRVVENTAAIRTAEEAITALIAADTDLQLQLDALKLYAEATRELADNNAEDIEAAQEAIEAAQDSILAAQEEIADLWLQLTADKEELQGLIGKNTSAIALLRTDLEATNQSIEDLKEAIEDELDTIKGDIGDIQEDIRGINTQILAINGNLASLHTLIVNRLTAITLASNAYVDGIEAIKFTSLVYKPMEVGENTLVPKSGYNMAIGAPALASYKFNPRTFNLSNADYNYVDRTAEVITTARAAAAASKLVAIEGAPKKNSTEGTVEFTLRRLNADKPAPQGNKENFVTLEATLKGAAVDANESGVVIAAHQELVYDNILNPSQIFISDKATLATAGDDAHYPVTFDDAKEGEVWYSDMTYDKIYNLKEKVATCLETATHKAFNIEDYNLSYKFSVASSDYDILVGETTTNQQEWIELVDANEGTFKAEDFNKEAIGRRPILKVELVDQAGNVVRRAFVKVEITAKKTEDILVGKSAYDLVLACQGTEAKYELDEMFIRENVYRIITNTQGETSMSHEEFWNLYDAANAVTKVTKNNEVLPGISEPAIVHGATGVGTATKKIVWAFDHSQVGSVGAAGSQLVATLTVKNKLSSSEYPEHVTFRFVVNVTNPTFELDKVENAIYWKNNMYQVNIAIPTSPQSPASAAVFSTNLPQAYSTYDVEFTPDVTECVSSEFVVVKTFANGEETMEGNVSTPLSGVGISGNNITLAKNGPDAAAVKTALNSEGGLQAVVQHVYTFANGDEVVVNEFMVNFIRPVTLNTQAPVSVTDAIDNGDVANFQWAGLLTDWRGNAIVAPDWDFTENCFGWWQFDHIMEYEYVPGYQRVVTAASVNVTYGTVSFTTGGSTTMYEGSVNWRIERRSRTGGYSWGRWYWNDWTPWATNPGPGNTGTFTTDDPMLTESEVELFLQALVDDINVPNGYYSGSTQTQYEFRLVDEDPEITPTTVPGGQLVEYTYVQSITYVPAVYEDVPGQWIPKKYEPTDYPNVDGTADGERNGDWVWKELCYPWIDYTPGQYWNFYGPIGHLTAHFGQVTTSLDYNDNQLPVNVTLTQVGNTVKYVNVGAPISESYEIYIPATITYGWGTLETVLTIVVVPAV